MKPPPLGECGIERQTRLPGPGYTRENDKPASGQFDGHLTGIAPTHGLDNEPISQFVNLKRCREPSETNRNTVPSHAGPAVQHHFHAVSIALDGEVHRVRGGNPSRTGKRREESMSDTCPLTE